MQESTSKTATASVFFFFFFFPIYDVMSGTGRCVATALLSKWNQSESFSIGCYCFVELVKVAYLGCQILFGSISAQKVLSLCHHYPDTTVYKKLQNWKPKNYIAVRGSREKILNSLTPFSFPQHVFVRGESLVIVPQIIFILQFHS